jgi:hypothetical protein
MRASLTAFLHRGLSPHQFTPMSGAHQCFQATPDCAMLLILRFWSGVPEAKR